MSTGSVSTVYRLIEPFIYGSSVDLLLKDHPKAMQLVCSDIEKEDSGGSEFFWDSLRVANLRIHEDFFKDFAVGDGYQLFTEYGNPLFNSPNVRKYIKYNIEDLLTRDFRQLFVRDQFTEKRVQQMFLKAVVEATRENVLDWESVPMHTVRQRDFQKYDFNLNFKKSYPVFVNDEFFGFVLSMNLSSLS